MLLQRGEIAPAVGDLSAGGPEPIELSATLADGDEISLRARPPGSATGSGRQVPVLFMPASLRSGLLIAAPTSSEPAARAAAAHFDVGERPSSAAPAAALLAGMQSLCESPDHGLVLLIEEPELFLRPQAQRYLYRLLRRFAELGNQVLYSTHEPVFLNVGRLEELALVEHGPSTGTVIIQPEPLGADESFRALSELDAERGELLLASAVLLVEGRTEKLTLPFVFNALGYDVDREAITIVDCGGKPNIPLFIRICHAARIPAWPSTTATRPPAGAPARPSAWSTPRSRSSRGARARSCSPPISRPWRACAGIVTSPRGPGSSSPASGPTACRPR